MEKYSLSRETFEQGTLNIDQFHSSRYTKQPFGREGSGTGKLRVCGASFDITTVTGFAAIQRNFGDCFVCLSASSCPHNQPPNDEPRRLSVRRLAKLGYFSSRRVCM